ncbi:MAG TPA: hypothetical protein VNH18_21045 [Bryobacteraceae bacterium]|nr:hypothetical protein [Bryobacteraceae bacterium]
MFSKWSAQRGHGAEAVATKLLEVSSKAQERAEQGDTGYALLTARNAVKACERDRERSRHRTAEGGALYERGL